MGQSCISRNCDSSMSTKNWKIRHQKYFYITCYHVKFKI